MTLAITSPIRGSFSVNPRTNIPALIDSDYIRVPLHETSGATVAQNSTDVLASSLTLSGTVDADQWTNAPFLTWSPTGATDNNYIADATTLAAQKTFCDLTTSWSDLIIAFRIYAVSLSPSGGATEEFILSNSMSGSGVDVTNGGWGISVASNSLTFKFRFSGATTYGSINGTQLGLSANRSVLVHAVKDGAVNYYVDGAIGGASGTLSGATYPACSSTAGLVFGARSRAGATPLHFLNLGGTGIRTAEHWLIRTTTSHAALVPTLALQLHNNPAETPLIMSQF